MPDRVINTFDANINGCGNAWGAASGVFDPAQDNTGNAGGSLYIASDFAVEQNTLTYFCNQPPNGAWYFPGPAFNLSDYKSVEFDIKWDTNKTLSIANFNNPPAGGEGNIVIWATDSPGFTARPTLGIVPVPAAAATGWAHISLAINPAITGIDPSVGIVFKKWISAAQQTAGGTYGFWVDNVILKGSDAPLPPPTLSLATAVPGLAFIAASGGQYDRQEIRTVGSNYSWVGASGPVSYSVNLAKLGENAPSGFTFFMHLIPGIAANRPDSDWWEPNVVMWRIANNADGSAWSDLRYKTNAPDSNGNMYTDGQGQFPGGLGNPTTKGIWTITFNQNTNIIITAPGGGTVTNNLPPAVMDIFNATPNMQINVGVVPGDLARLGQMAVVTNVKITGTPGEPNLNSNFLGVPRDTNTWSIVASSPNNGVQEIPAGAYWLGWTLPAQGFSLQSSTKVAGGVWADPTLVGFDGGGKHLTLLRQGDLPGSNAGFFRMIKRVPFKLQVLLPGETNAPGTVTGKIGTPTAQAAYVPFSFTVNMVDSTWHIVSSTDTVTLTSSDPVFEPSVITVPPRTVPLVNGTVTIEAYLGTAGQQTITATDVTDATMLPNTSSRVTLQ